jgi:hypothetical protein
MKTATGVVLVGMAGLLIVCGGSHSNPGGTVSASPQTPAPDTKPTYGGGDGGAPIPQDKLIVISVHDGRLQVRSNDALIHEGQPLSWKVEGLKGGQSVEIDFEVNRYQRYKAKDLERNKKSENVKGPFERVDRPYNPYRGRFFLDERTPQVLSGKSDSPGYFKYHVVLRQGTTDIDALDPGVLVKNDY